VCMDELSLVMVTSSTPLLQMEPGNVILGSCSSPLVWVPPKANQSDVLHWKVFLGAIQTS
jgi:hypothetical protein